MRRALASWCLATLLAAPLGAQLPSCSDGTRIRQCQIPPIAGTFVPPDSVRGDMEFDGNAVSVWLSAARRLTEDSTALVVDLEMVAMETVPDSTWIAGADTLVLFTAEEGWKISELPDLALSVADSTSLLIKGKSEISLTPAVVAHDRTQHEGLCERHPSDICQNTTNNGLVARWTVWGDSGQRDLGETRVHVQLASMTVKVRRKDGR